MAQINSLDLFNKLRSEYPVFEYEGFELNFSNGDLFIKFLFNIPGVRQFRPVTIIKSGELFPGLTQQTNEITPLIENIAFNIGMIELVSYWKTTCSPTIIIKPASLTPEQIIWWKNLYYNGLGEFFYLNSIVPDPDSFVEITPTGDRIFKPSSFKRSDNFLVPIGGGKDSAVTLELLLSEGKTILPVIMNPRGATIDTITAAGLQMNNVMALNRSLDSGLLDLNARGFLNGHTPFSAMLAFYTLMVSALTGYANIALSNESSASEVTVPGTNINHQYSKSWEFENDFRNYYSRYISPDFNYFSFLRPLSELQIAKIFSTLKAYHNVFRSCNAGSKTDIWCGKCPKCLFTHIMLSAFTGLPEANRILGKPMLENQNLKNIFDELCGFTSIKPFECVGTTEEVRQALEIIVSQKKPVTPILLERYLKLRPEIPIKPDFTLIDTRHFLKHDLLNLLMNQLR